MDSKDCSWIVGKGCKSKADSKASSPAKKAASPTKKKSAGGRSKKLEALPAPPPRRLTVAGESIVFTGFRSKELEQAIKDNGGKVTATITKSTTLLVYKPDGKMGTKMSEASKRQIKILELDVFKRLYGLA